MVTNLILAATLLSPLVGPEKIETIPRSLNGIWSIQANGAPGDLIIRIAPDGKITGTIFQSPLEGEFDPQSRKVVIRRLQTPCRIKPRPVQEFTGVLNENDQHVPPLYVLHGTFKALVEENWGKMGMEYSWTASTLKNSPNGTLKELQGNWKVNEHSGEFNQLTFLPNGTFLDQPGLEIEIRDNELRSGSKVIGHLATELFAEKDSVKPTAIARHNLVLTLSDGRAVLFGYQVKNEVLEIVYPHTVGNLGGANIRLKRPIGKEN